MGQEERTKCPKSGRHYPQHPNIQQVNSKRNPQDMPQQKSYPPSKQEKRQPADIPAKDQMKQSAVQRGKDKSKSQCWPWQTNFPTIMLRGTIA